MAVINYSSSVGIIGLTSAGEIYRSHSKPSLHQREWAMVNFINV
jgi:hypothetical protein